MDRLTAFAAGAVAALAVCAGALGLIAANAAPTRPAAESNEIAAEFAVEVGWFDDTNNPCPTETSLGCYISEEDPDVIYVREDLGPLTDSVILHEIGHVMQGRLGLPFDECGADDFARSMGAAAIYPEC
jgi:hypothetical protein